MAPSRALVRRITSTSVAQFLCLTPRLASTSASRLQLSQMPPALHLGWPQPLFSPAICTRSYSQQATVPEPPDYLNEAELHVFNKIKAELEPVKLEVQDISGGCGSMYALDIESPKFNGLTVIKQHKMVNEVLKEEIKSWHGVQLRTKAA
ncbi:bola protein [Pyrenochaeta sp. MPI-SDFR-AT-0127]|nr:bola protein [Pyrenochaeta sp. MPI-SDFR-AT-0127]